MAGITKKQIADWKKEHGGVYHLPVEDKEAYLREPNMMDFKRGFTAMQEDGDIAFGEVMLKSLWLDGDQEILKSDEYFLPARKILVKFFKYDDAVIEDLESKKSKVTIDGKSCIIRVITRDDLKTAERKNPSSKPFVTQEKLFEAVCLEKDDAFADRNVAAIRFPLYQALEKLQNKKVAILKKL